MTEVYGLYLYTYIYIFPSIIGSSPVATSEPRRAHAAIVALLVGSFAIIFVAGRSLILGECREVLPNYFNRFWCSVSD